MEVSFKVNSSFVIGIASGTLIGAFASLTLCPSFRKLTLGALQPLCSLVCSKGQKRSCTSILTFDLKSGRSEVVEPKRTTCSTTKANDNGETNIAVETSAVESASMWYRENNGKYHAVYLTLKTISFDARSPFQHVQVIETNQFGRTLVMDSQTQVSLF